MGARIPLPRHLQHRPFVVKSGLRAGLGRDRLRGADLHKPYHGIRSTTAADDLEGRCHSLQQRMPTDAFFCSATAARIMGVPLPGGLERSSLLHIGVPAPHRALTAQGIIGHKLQVTDAQMRLWRGLRISSPELAWCELASILTLPDLVAAADYLIHWELPITTESRLREAVTQHPGRRGKPALRAALDLVNNRSESRKESQLRVLLVLANIAGLVANLELTTTGGFRYRGDLAVPERRVIIEYQSDYHAGTEQFRADMTRISRLQADGWYVFQVNADDLRNPEELVRRILRVLAERPFFS